VLEYIGSRLGRPVIDRIRGAVRLGRVVGPNRTILLDGAVRLGSAIRGGRAVCAGGDDQLRRVVRISLGGCRSLARRSAFPLGPFASGLLALLLGPLSLGLGGPLALLFILARGMLAFGLDRALMCGALAFTRGPVAFGLLAFGAFAFGLLAGGLFAFGLGGAFAFGLLVCGAFAFGLLVCGAFACGAFTLSLVSFGLGGAFPLGPLGPFAFRPGGGFMLGLFPRGPVALAQDLGGSVSQFDLSEAFAFGLFSGGAFELGLSGPFALRLRGAFTPLGPAVPLRRVIASPRLCRLVRGSGMARPCLGAIETRTCDGSRRCQPRQFIGSDVGILVRHPSPERPGQLRAHSVGRLRAAPRHVSSTRRRHALIGGRWLLPGRFVFLLGLGVGSVDDGLHALQQFRRQLRSRRR
jgi:hypothetical protein